MHFLTTKLENWFYNNVWDAELEGRKPYFLDCPAAICKAMYAPANLFNLPRENIPKFASDLSA